MSDDGQAHTAYETVSAEAQVVSALRTVRDAGFVWYSRRGA